MYSGRVNYAKSLLHYGCVCTRVGGCGHMSLPRKNWVFTKIRRGCALNLCIYCTVSSILPKPSLSRTKHAMVQFRECNRIQMEFLLQIVMYDHQFYQRLIVSTYILKDFGRSCISCIMHHASCIIYRISFKNRSSGNHPKIFHSLKAPSFAPVSSTFDIDFFADFELK